MTQEVVGVDDLNTHVVEAKMLHTLEKPTTCRYIEKFNMNMAYHLIKRVFDIVSSLIGLIVLSPFFIIIAFLIKREDGGSVLYRRICISSKGSYAMLKFRTMVSDSEDLEKYLSPEEIEEYHKDIKLEKDPRITKIGHFLRAHSLDELPQLVNVVKGEMSIIGPRPMIEEETAFYSEGEREQILKVKPGITGYWQVNGRSDSTYESGNRQRLELYYIEHQSIWLDIKILFKTVGVVLTKVGAR